MAVTPAPPPNPVVIYTLSNSLLEGILDYCKWAHWTDNNGVIQCTSTKDQDKIGGNLLSSFTLDGDQKEILKCQSTVDDASNTASNVEKSKWPKALLACNKCNGQYVHGNGLLVTDEGDWEGQLIYESGLYVKPGITETFLKKYIQIHFAHAIDFFKQMHNDWKLY